MEKPIKKTKKTRKKTVDELPPIQVMDNKDLSSENLGKKTDLSAEIKPIKVVSNNEISGIDTLELRKKDKEIYSKKQEDDSFTIMRVEALWDGEATETLDGKDRPLWDLDLLKIPYIWSHYAVKGAGVKATIIDSGINSMHPVFAGKQVSGKSFLKGIDDATDQTGHGTWVAGKISGSGIGIAPGSTVCSLRVLDGNGTGSSAATNKALAYCIADETTEIINLSLGSPFRDVEQERLIWKLYRKGVLIVAAAGNRGQQSILYPAAFDGVLTIGAIDKKEARANFSNYGASLEIVAPGVSCYGPHLGTAYRRLEGTSMAAPMVTGVLTLALSYLKKQKPKLSKIDRRDLIISALKESARDLGPKGWDLESGFGCIDPVGLFTKLA